MTPEQKQRLAEIKEQVDDVENRRYFYSSAIDDVTKQRDELHKQRAFLLTLLDQAQRDTERLQQALNGYVPDQAALARGEGTR